MTERTFIHEIENNYGLESELGIYLQFFTDWYYKRTSRRIAWSVEKINLNSKIFKRKNDRLIMQSKCANCGIKSQDLWKSKKQKVYWVI